MKKTTRLIGVVAIAMVLSIAFSGVALASQTACTTPETESIKTITQIKCDGMMTESEKLNWETSNEDLINNPPLGSTAGVTEADIHEVVGNLKYNEDLKVTAGLTNFVKDMDIDTGADPNLNVMVSLGYLQYGTIGSLSHDEDVKMGITSDWAATSAVILCPFASAAVEWLPAACEDVSASSSMVVTEVLATTRTKVGMTEEPVNLDYSITATGSGGAGTLAQGSIAAEFDVHVEDGSAHWTDAGHCSQGDVTNYTLGSKLSYSERSTANGFWEFGKSMSYTSRVRP